MQLTLKQTELEIAVKDYIHKMGITRTVGAVTFSTTRGPEGGVTTEVEISDATVVDITVPVPRANKGANKLVPTAAEPAADLAPFAPIAPAEQTANDRAAAPVLGDGKSLFGNG